MPISADDVVAEPVRNKGGRPRKEEVSA
jgi:hypothetical protein